MKACRICSRMLDDYATKCDQCGTPTISATASAAAAGVSIPGVSWQPLTGSPVSPPNTAAPPQSPGPGGSYVPPRGYAQPPGGNWQPGQAAGSTWTSGNPGLTPASGYSNQGPANPQPTSPSGGLVAIDEGVYRALIHPLQPRRFALALVFSILLFPLIAAGLVVGTVFLVVPLFALLFWVSGRTMYAFFLGNSILVSNLNYPKVYAIAEELKTLLRYQKPVDIFVYEQGNFNASLFKFFFFRRAVFINSELLEKGVSDDEIRWLIGRFVGYLRARREAGFWGWTIRAAEKLLIFNLFLEPYERALVYTGDRLALAVIRGDISCAVSVMQKLLVGRQLGYSINPGGVIDQQRRVKGSFFAFLSRLTMRFPHMTARYVDLIQFSRVVYPIQYARFEADNPGIPGDLGSLVAIPQ